MDRVSDGQLIAQYLHGDRAALEALIRRHLAPTLRFVRPYVRTQEDAEEVVQETFVRAWRNIRQFDRTRPFRPWVFQIAKRVAMDAMRKGARSASTIEFTDASERDLATALATRNPMERLGGADDARVLTVALERLPSNDRIVLILRYQRELTFREIGSALGAPLHTVKSRHRRALIRLRAVLGGLGMERSTIA